MCFLPTIFCMQPMKSKKSLLSVALSALLLNAVYAVEISPDSLSFDLFSASDTTDFRTELEMEESQFWCGVHPADSIYFGCWDTEWVNPYKIKIDSLPDSVRFLCKNYVHPIASTRITSHFGLRRYRFHYGIDIGLTVGDTVRSVFDGQVRIIDYEKRGYGHYVVVRHPNGFETVYAHLSRVLVHKNDTLKAGQPIALGGNTGRSTGPHLHFEVRFLGNAINPTKLIDFDGQQVLQENFLMVKKDAYDHKKILDELAKAQYCTVRSGDTLSGLARRYGTTVSKLCKLNKISASSIIRIGQRLRYR